MVCHVTPAAWSRKSRTTHKGIMTDRPSNHHAIVQPTCSDGFDDIQLVEVEGAAAAGRGRQMAAVASAAAVGVVVAVLPGEEAVARRLLRGHARVLTDLEQARKKGFGAVVKNKTKQNNRLF